MNIIVNGIDLEMPEVPITQTLQVNDYFDLKDRRVNYTNSFTIPDTPHNTSVFQLAGEVGSVSEVPYRLLDCQLIHNGVEITNAAKLRINSRDSSGYKCTIQDGNASLYDLIEGKNLSDIDYTGINHILTPTTYLDPQFAGHWSTGYIYGIGDWGKPFTTVIEYDHQIPCLYKRWVLEKIFLGAGISPIADFSYLDKQVISPNVSFDNDIDVIPPLLMVHSDSVYNEFKEANSPTTYLFKNELFPIIFNSGLATVDGDDLVLTESGFYNIDLDGSFSFSKGDWAKVIIKKNDNIIRTFYFDASSPSSYDVSGDNYFYGLSGDVIATYIEIRTIPVTVFDTVRHRIRFITRFNTKLYQDNNAINVNFGTLFSMKQTDFLKDCMQQMGLLSQVKRDGSYYFKRIEDIINGDAVDWSSKFIRSNSVTFSNGGSFTQKNRMAYKYDDKEDPWGDAFIQINDEKLSPEESILFQSPYRLARKSDITYNSYKLSRAVYWEEDADGFFEPVQNDMFTFNTVLIEDDISISTSGGGAPATYSGTFTYLDSFPLRQSSFLTYHYLQYNGLVNNPEVRMIDLDLNAFDIHNIDFLTKYYCDDLGYFLLNSVKYSGGVSECEIIMIKNG
jgi:hypothetical protein